MATKVAAHVLTGRKVFVGRGSVDAAYRALTRIMVNTGLTKHVRTAFFSLLCVCVCVCVCQRGCS